MTWIFKNCKNRNDYELDLHPLTTWQTLEHFQPQSSGPGVNCVALSAPPGGKRSSVLSAGPPQWTSGFPSASRSFTAQLIKTLFSFCCLGQILGAIFDFFFSSHQMFQSTRECSWVCLPYKYIHPTIFLHSHC